MSHFHYKCLIKIISITIKEILMMKKLKNIWDKNWKVCIFRTISNILELFLYFITILHVTILSLSLSESKGENVREIHEEILEWHDCSTQNYVVTQDHTAKSNYPQTTLEDCLESRFDFRCNLELATQC